jgi:hypothetical protein
VQVTVEPAQRQPSVAVDGRPNETARIFPIELTIPSGMALYAESSAWTLARVHARSGDRVAIASHLGGCDVFDQAMAAIAELYADQNELDHSTLHEAVVSACAEAVAGQ